MKRGVFAIVLPLRSAERGPHFRRPETSARVGFTRELAEWRARQAKPGHESRDSVHVGSANAGHLPLATVSRTRHVPRRRTFNIAERARTHLRMLGSGPMMPYGAPQPPFVGTCPRCGQPVYGTHVARPEGPIHSLCYQAMTAAARPQMSGAKIAAIVLAVVGGVVGIVVVGVVLGEIGLQREKKKGTVAAATASSQTASLGTHDETPGSAGFLYCDSRFDYCEQPELQAIKVYANERDYNLQDGRECKRRPTLCAQPSRPLFSVPSRTKVTIVEGPLMDGARTVRIDDGPHKGKSGVVELKYFHKALP